MKSKKVTMLAAALVVAVVAFAAVGYAAATSYKATTENTENNADVAYITVTQGGDGDYATESWLTKVYFDTINGDTTTSFTYKILNDWKLGTESTKTLVKDTENGNLALISEALSLTIKGTNSADESLKIEVSTSGLTAIDGLVYKMALAKNATVDGKEVKTITGVIDVVPEVTSEGKPTTWTFNNVTVTNATLNAGGETFWVFLFIEGASAGLSTAPDAHAGFATDSSFTFTVTADDE